MYQTMMKQVTFLYCFALVSHPFLHSARIVFYRINSYIGMDMRFGNVLNFRNSSEVGIFI